MRYRTLLAADQAGKYKHLRHHWRAAIHHTRPHMDHYSPLSCEYHAQISTFFICSVLFDNLWLLCLFQIDELASALSFSSRHSSLDSLASLDSWSDSPISGSPVPAGRTSPLHRRFRISAKKALLMWVRDQCQKWVFVLLRSVRCFNF